MKNSRFLKFSCWAVTVTGVSKISNFDLHYSYRFGLPLNIPGGLYVMIAVAMVPSGEHVTRTQGTGKGKN